MIYFPVVLNSIYVNQSAPNIEMRTRAGDMEPLIASRVVQFSLVTQWRRQGQIGIRLCLTVVACHVSGTQPEGLTKRNYNSRLCEFVFV
jgi:NADH:ubiquinone oxidoreductase subunit E